MQVALCARRGGYLIEAAEGLVLAAFHDPAAAAAWALDSLEALQRLDWAPPVLSHPQGREVYGGSSNGFGFGVGFGIGVGGGWGTVAAEYGGGPDLTSVSHQRPHSQHPHGSASPPPSQPPPPPQPPQQQLLLLHRGPRVRAGIHVGEVTCDVHSSTGRLSYR